MQLVKRKNEGVEMEYKYLLEIGLIILIVKIFTIITQKIKMPKVLGGLIAGIVLGPAMLNIVQNSTILEALSKFGIILIMFLAGMETSIKKFISNPFIISDSNFFGSNAFNIISP